jgi:hypothetical protein
MLLGALCLTRACTPAIPNRYRITSPALAPRCSWAGSHPIPAASLPDMCTKPRCRSRCASWPNARITCSRALTLAYPRRLWSRRGVASCASMAPRTLASISSCAPSALVPRRPRVGDLAREEQVRQSSMMRGLYPYRNASVTVPPLSLSKKKAGRLAIMT